MRPGASLWSLLLLWLCMLGAGPARHAAQQPFVARSAVELALRDVAETPLLASRAVATRLSSVRLAERDAPSSHVATPLPSLDAIAPSRAAGVRITLALQGDAHAGRPRWRPYDAAAPPSLSRTAR